MAIDINRMSLDTNESGITMAAFSRALEREAHVLTQRPDLIWQQLHNRLQWENKQTAELIEKECIRRSTLVDHPWIRTRTKMRESEALLLTFSGHTNYISKCAFSPDGTRVVSASDDKTLKIWDVSPGRELITLRGHANMVLGCAFSPNGKWIVSASKDKTLRIWDAINGVEIGTFSGHLEGVNACAISPNGAYVCSAGWDNTLKVWDVQNGEVLHTFRGHNGLVYGCAFSPDGEMIISASSDQTLKLWRIETGELLQTLTGHTERVLDCTFSPNSELIISASMDGTLKIWSTKSGKTMRTLIGHNGYVNGCACSPDGSLILSASSDKTLKLWDLASGNELRTLIGHTQRVLGCAFSPDGSRVVSASMDGKLKVWDANYAKGEQCTLGHEKKITDCAIGPVGDWILTASEDQTLKKWDGASGTIKEVVDNQVEGSGLCDISPDGKKIAWSNNFMIKIRDESTGKEVLSNNKHDGTISACRFSPDGKRIISAGDYTIKIWDACSGKEIRSLEGHSAWVSDAAYTPDCKHIISASNDKTLKIWDAASGNEIRTLSGHTDGLSACAISPDGKYILSGGDDKTLRLWDADSGKVVYTLYAYSKIKDLAFSPDGACFISAGMDKMLRVWQVSDGHERAAIPLLGSINTIALHPTQPYVICGDEGGNIYQLDLFGLEYGPIIVTAIHDCTGYTVCCPACQRGQPIRSEQLGSDIECADENCMLRIHVNPFCVEKDVQIGITYQEKEYNELIANKNGEKALEVIEHILEIEPQNRKYQIEHICLLLALRRIEDAESAMKYMRTMGIEPDDEEQGRIFFLKGAAILELKDRTQSWQKEALEAFDLSLQSMPISRSWFYRASILHGLGAKEAALESYLKARALQMEEATSQKPLMSHDTWKRGLYGLYFGGNERDEIDVEVGWLYFSLNDFSKAEAEFQAMLKRGVEDPMAVYGLGLALIGLQQFQQACSYFKRFVQIAKKEHQSFIPRAKEIIGKICKDI